ncbi:MAG TPA: AMP-binding protein [Thermoanaerobaculia bacterium]|nr:AMP-binding protein [Thermoanaerobaculia bacterium]
MPSSTTSSIIAFLSARDFLLARREDYESAYAGFRWPALDTFNWALDYFDLLARGNHHTALWLVDEAGHDLKVSFAAMAERSNQAANYLRALGVKRGDRVLVMLPNVLPLWEITLAAMKLGAVTSPATTLLSTADLADRIDRGEMRHVITDPAGVEKLAGISGSPTRIVVGGTEKAPPGWHAYGDVQGASAEFTPDGPTRADDPLLLYFTSGTTAKPKMVLHTHQSYPVGHLSTMYWIGLRAGDVHLNISSPGWAKHAWSCFFAPWNAGATIFIPPQGRFDPQKTLEAIVRCGVTTLCAPPTVWRMLVLEDLAAYPVKLREVVGAGEPLNPEVITRVKEAWGLTIRDGYGQTETTCQIGNSPGQPVKLGSMGRPLPGYRIALVDPEDHEGEEGEIGIDLRERPTPLMAGYLDSPERSAELLGGAYYRTSDVATRDADGYYWYVGRADDVFKSSDYRVSPFELESALLEHTSVAEAAVVPSPDAIRLAVPKAYVILKPGLAPSPAAAHALFRFSRQRLPPYARLRRLEFAELPKTISGKIRRVELRAQEQQKHATNVRGEQEYWEDDFPDLE